MKLRWHMTIQMGIAGFGMLVPFGFDDVRLAVTAAPLVTAAWMAGFLLLFAGGLGANRDLWEAAEPGRDTEERRLKPLAVVVFLAVHALIYFAFPYVAGLVFWGSLLGCCYCWYFWYRVLWMLVRIVSFLLRLAWDVRKEGRFLEVWVSAPLAVTGGVVLQTFMAQDSLSFGMRLASSGGVVLLLLAVLIPLRGYFRRIQTMYKNRISCARTGAGTLRYQMLVSRIWNAVALAVALIVFGAFLERLPARMAHIVPRLRPEIDSLPMRSDTPHAEENPQAGILESITSVSSLLPLIDSDLARKDYAAAFDHQQRLVALRRQGDDLSELAGALLLQGKIASQINRYNEAYTTINESLTLVSKFQDVNEEWLCGANGSLGWSATLIGKYKEALAAGEKAVSLLQDDTPCPARMNLAHAYLFNGRFEEAKAIYTKYLGTAFEDGRVWNDELRNDFKLLREAGHDHPDIKKIEALLDPRYFNESER